MFYLQIETLKQNLSEERSISNSLKCKEEDHQLFIKKLTDEHQQVIEDLKSEVSKQKLTYDTDFHSIINEKNEEIHDLHQQLQCQSSKSDTHQDTIETLRKELHEYEKKFIQQSSQLDHLLDEQKHMTETILRLNNILDIDATNHDELLEQFVYKMEQFQLLKTESERLNNDLIKQKSEQTNLQHEHEQLEQQLDDIKNELNHTKQELITNKQKYENQLNQLNRSYEQLDKEKQEIMIQYENIQSQFIDKTNQYHQFQIKFDKLLNDKDEQILKYQNDFNEQQIHNEGFHRNLNDLNDELKSKTNEILTLQTNSDKLQQILQSKIDEIEEFSKQNMILIEDNNRKEKLLSEQKQLTEVCAALEEKFNSIRSEKAELENQLDKIRLQMQTTEVDVNKRKQENAIELEQTEKQIKELRVRFIEKILQKISFRIKR